HAGVVDQDVHVAEALPRGLEELRDLVLDRQVRAHGDGVSTSTDDVAYHLVRTVLARGVVHHDGRALRREMPGDRGAYSLRCARDDCHLIVEPSHGATSLLSVEQRRSMRRTISVCGCL